MDYKYLFEPIQIGNMRIENRIFHPATDAGSSYMNGEVSALHAKPFKHHVKVITSSTILEVGEGYAILQDKSFKMNRMETDAVVTCHVRQKAEFLNELRVAGIPAINIGDSNHVGNLHAAVMAGATAGKNIDAGAIMNPNYAMINNLPLEVKELLLGK